MKSKHGRIVSIKRNKEVQDHYNFSDEQMVSYAEYIGDLKFAMPQLKCINGIPKYINYMYNLCGRFTMIYEIEESIIKLRELHLMYSTSMQ